MLAVTTESDAHLVVTRRQQVATDGSTIVTKLDLVLGVPARIIADHGHERQTVTHGRVDFGAVKSERAVAQYRDDWRLGLRDPRRQRERQRRSDRAGDAVDNPMRRAQAGLGPLADLTTIAHQNRIRITVQDLLERPQRLHWMQAICYRRRVIPRRGTKGNRLAHFGEPTSATQ